MVEQIGHTNMCTAAVLPWLLWAVDGYLATGRRCADSCSSRCWRWRFLPVINRHSLFAAARHGLCFGIARTCLQHESDLAQLRFSSLQDWRWQRCRSYRRSLRNSQSDSYSRILWLVLNATTIRHDFSGALCSGGGNGRSSERLTLTGRFGEYAAYAGVLTLMLAQAPSQATLALNSGPWFCEALFMALGRFMPFRLYEVVSRSVLSLFRGPTRHLMEVHFALAVLAGRGLRRSEPAGRSRCFHFGHRRFSLSLNGLTVTWWRPAAFHLAREIRSV
jgi:hypothetical protein